MFKLKSIILLLLAITLCGCDLSTSAINAEAGFLYYYTYLCSNFSEGGLCQIVGPGKITDDMPASDADSAPYTIWVAEANSATAMSKVTIDPISGVFTIAPSPNFPGIHAGGIAAWLDDPTQRQYGLYLWHDNKVEVMSSDSTPVATITLPTQASILDFTISPDGKTAAVVVNGDAHLYTLDLVARQFLNTTDLGSKNLRASAILPDGRGTLVTDSANGKAYYVTGAITPFPITQPTELGKPVVAPGPTGTFMIPDVTNNLLFSLDVLSGSAVQLPVPGLLDPREILFKGSTAYVLSSPSAGFGPGSLTILDASGNSPQVTSTVQLGDQPSGLSLSPLGAYQFVANSGDGNVVMIDPDGKVTTFGVGAKPVGVVAMH